MRRFLIAGFVLMVPLSCGKSPQEQILSMFQKGVDQVNRYQFEAAAATFDKIGQINPSSPLGYFGSGLILEHKLMVYDALEVYLSIIRTKPSFAPAYAAAWRLYAYLEEWEFGLLAAAEYARLLPDDPDAHLMFARALINIGQPGRAKQEADSAAARGADRVLTALVRAYALAADHKYDSAAQVAGAVIASLGGSVEQYAAAADYFEAAGLIDSAVALGMKAVEKADYRMIPAMAEFSRAIRHGYYRDARRMLNELKARGTPEVVTAGLRILYHLPRGEYSMAMRAVDAYSRQTSMTISTLVYDLMVRGKLEEDIMTVIKNAGAVHNIMEQGKLDSGFRDFMKYVLGVLAASYLSDQTGLQQLENVPPVLANRLKPRLLTTYCYYRTGQIDKYEELMALLTKYHSGQPDWLTGLADICGDRFVRKYAEADKYYRMALEIDPWYRPAFENGVGMYRRVDQPDKALKLYQDFPHFESQFPYLSTLKAICLFEAGQFESGMPLFRQDFPLVRGDLEMFHQAVTLLDKADLQNLRQELYELLVGINPQNADALNMAARYELARVQYEAAGNLAQQALSAEPGDVSASALYARALYGRGQREEAFDIFEQNLTREEYNVDNTYHFSRILATEQVDLDRAANLARRAVFDSRHDVNVWMNLSYVYYQMGRYDLSRGEALKASRKYTAEPEPFFRIGMAMYKEGKEEAKENLEKAITYGLRGEYLETARQTLKNL